MLIAVPLVISGLAVAGAPATAQATCARGGACAIGDTGPGGGVVFHVSSTPQWWGQVLEGRPFDRVKGLPWSLTPGDSVYSTSAPAVAARQRIDSKRIGMGQANTTAIVAQNGPGRYAAGVVSRAVIGGKSDWFLPSKDEMDAFWRVQATYGRPSIQVGPYWTSSENAPSFAWYQMSQDGTQFTDENGVGRVNGKSITGNKRTTRNNRHEGSGFPSLPYRVIAVRAFGRSSGHQPPASNPSLTGKTCTASSGCHVGDIGPAGGIVFYDAGRHQSWGRWLEVAPESTEVDTYPWRILPVNESQRPVYRNLPGVSARIQRINNKAIGMGEVNTARIVRAIGRGKYAARYAWTLRYNGYDDWFLPSENELYEIHSVLHTATTPIGGFKKGYYWSSSEYDFVNAWTVNFKDGQMFDREKWKIGNSETKPLRVRAIRAFG